MLPHVGGPSHIWRLNMVEYEPGWMSCSHWGLYYVYPVRIFT
jgi:hypothetical protein